MDVSESKEYGQSIHDSDASSKCDDSWSTGSDNSHSIKTKHSRKIKKKEKCLTSDQCFNF